MKINELLSGMSVEINVLVKTLTQGVTTKGTPYLSLVLQDDTATIDAKFWDVGNQINDIKAGVVYKVTGTVLNYKNVNQLKVEKMVEDPTIPLESLLKVSTHSKTYLQDEIKKYVDLITNHSIKKIVVEILKQYHEQFFEYPAAMTNHHNYVRGLGEHVVSMLHVATSLVKNYPFLDESLLYGGIILHDFGKVIELSGPIATTYTSEGILLGHISIAVSKIEAISQQLNIHDESVILLKHIILSHHGKLEFGSPVLPLIPEAEIIHYIDNIDARMNAIQNAFSQIETGQFTPKIFALENRGFYKANK